VTWEQTEQTASKTNPREVAHGVLNLRNEQGPSVSPPPPLPPPPLSPERLARWQWSASCCREEENDEMTAAHTCHFKLS